MKRLGKFTKTIYDENYDFSNCRECCTLITDEQANDEEFINKHHIKDLMDCVCCLGCPAAKGGEGVMTEYINRAELIENLNKLAPEHYNALINHLITKQPTADVQEVVRCKNCRFFDPYDKVEDFDGQCVVRDCETDKEEFCSYGSKRGDEK